MISGEVTVAFDDRVLAEYRDVLYRPQFDFERRAVAELLSYFMFASLCEYAPPLLIDLPDPSDALFLELAAAVDTVLISDKLRHFPSDQRCGVVVLSPVQFLKNRLAGSELSA